MSIDTVLTLIQFIALALPAIGIYMQIAHDMRKDRIENTDDNFPIEGSDATEAQLSQYGQSFHLSRLSIAFLVLSGILLFVNLLIQLPPKVGGPVTKVGNIVAIASLYVGILTIVFAIILFAGGVIFQQVALEDEMRATRAVGILIDQSKAAFRYYVRGE